MAHVYDVAIGIVAGFMLAVFFARRLGTVISNDLQKLAGKFRPS